MGLLNGLERLTGKAAPETTTAVLREATPPSGWPTVVGLDPDEHLWRNLTGISPRDLTSWDQARMIEVCFFLARTNPMAKRVVNTIAEFVWGGGPIITAVDPIVDQILHEFWDDPVNIWSIKGHQRVRDLSIYGEQAWSLHTNGAGRVRIGYVRPSHIKDILQDPGNPEIVKQVILYRNPAEAGSGGMGPSFGTSEGAGDAGQDPFYTVLHREEDVHHGHFGYWTGDILYLAVNKTVDGKRGVSDLYDLADWIDLYDQFLFARTEKVAHMNQWFWDVEIKGADQKKIEDFLRDQLKAQTRPGAIRAHNESVVWNPMVPNLAADDAHTDSEAIKSHILSGAGLPPTWFPGGEGTRAAAVEMAEPTMRSLMTRQAFVRHHLELLLKFQAQQYLRENPEILQRVTSTAFLVEMDAVSSRDLYRSGAAVYRVGDIIIKAFQAGLIQHDEATRQYRSLMNMLGMGFENLRQLEAAVDDSRLEMFPGDAPIVEPYLGQTASVYDLLESSRGRQVVQAATRRHAHRRRERAIRWLKEGRVAL